MRDIETIYTELLVAYKGEEVILLVEGESDRNHFKKIINKKKCLLDYADGKKNCKELKEMLSNSDKLKNKNQQVKCIIILDLDYDLFSNEVIQDSCIFYTDKTDLESTIFSLNSSTLMIENFISKNHNMKIKDALYINETKLKENSSFIGMLRLLKHLNKNWDGSINFLLRNEEYYREFFNALNQELDKEKAIKHILPKVKHDYEEIKNGSFYDFIFKKIEKTKLEHSIQDPFSVTNGHDITKILYLILTYQLIWQINYPDFEYSFLDSISLDYFYQTLLYNQVTVKYDIFIKNHNN